MIGCAAIGLVNGYLYRNEASTGGQFTSTAKKVCNDYETQANTIGAKALPFSTCFFDHLKGSCTLSKVRTHSERRHREFLEHSERQAAAGAVLKAAATASPRASQANATAVQVNGQILRARLDSRFISVSFDIASLVRIIYLEPVQNDVSWSYDTSLRLQIHGRCPMDSQFVINTARDLAPFSMYVGSSTSDLVYYNISGIGPYDFPMFLPTSMVGGEFSGIQPCFTSLILSRC